MQIVSGSRCANLILLVQTSERAPMARLISDAYKKLNEELHKSNPLYGTKAAKHEPAVANFVTTTRAASLLDYGCGKGMLKPALQALCPSLDIREYDPAIAGKSARPDPAEVVVCLDVMEHIEPEALQEVLSDIRSVTKRYAIFTVAVKEAKKVLADGRNAHLIVQLKILWAEQFAPHFDTIDLNDFGDHWFFAVLSPKQS